MNTISPSGISPLLFSLPNPSAQGDGVSQLPRSASGAASAEGASAATSVTLAYQQTSYRSHTFLASGVEKYQAIAEQPPRTQAASNILAFISQRLGLDQAEGASDEQLGSRLAAGLDGFLQGYGEARAQLEGLGALSPEVDAAISLTFQQVLAGIDELAAQYGLESPVGDELRQAAAATDSSPAPVEPAVSPALLSSLPAGGEAVAAVFADFAESIDDSAQALQALLEKSTLDYREIAQRDFSFRVTTRDGDEVSIFLASAASSRLQYQGVNYSDAASKFAQAGYRYQSASSSQLTFAVEGELNNEELGAINDLLRQVGEVSASFFAGDLAEAFDLALAVGFDDQQIAGFALNLHQQSYTRVAATYRQVRQLGDEGKPVLSGADSKIQQIARFIEILEQARLAAERLGVGDASLAALSDFLARSNHPDHPQRDGLKPLLARILPHMPRRAADAAEA